MFRTFAWRPIPLFRAVVAVVCVRHDARRAFAPRSATPSPASPAPPPSSPGGAPLAPSPPELPEISCVGRWRTRAPPVTDWAAVRELLGPSAMSTRVALRAPPAAASRVEGCRGLCEGILEQGAPVETFSPFPMFSFFGTATVFLGRPVAAGSCMCFRPSVGTLVAWKRAPDDFTMPVTDFVTCRDAAA